MQDFYTIIDFVLYLMSIDIYIWGFHLNLVSVFITTTLFSIVGYAISRLYE